MSSNSRLGSPCHAQSPVLPGARWHTLIAFLAALTLGQATGAFAASWTVVATGLDNPRGLDFAPNGALYVAESGRGGGPNAPSVPGGEGSPVYLGNTGAITRIVGGVQERIVTGLPSLANADGSRANGPSNISFGQVGHALVTMGLGRPPALRTQLGPAAAALGTLQQMAQNGQLKLVADIGVFEAARDPDGNGPDTNPTGVTSEKGGVAYVADAGGNSLLQVSANGTVSLVAVFPNVMVARPPFLPPGPAQIPMQAVPTSVVRGPDGALYVSQLTGFPFPPGAARIFRVVPGSAPTVYATGFTNVIDLAFDASGNLYVLEIDQNGLLAPSPTGRLARVGPGGAPTVTIASDGLVMPGGLVIGPDKAIYISNYSASPAVGEVIRLQP